VTPLPAPATPKPRRRRRTGLIAAIVVAVLALLALGGGWYLGSGRYTTAPPVVKLSQTAAIQKLDKAGLKHQVAKDGAFSEDIPLGAVADQRPKANGRVRRGGTVTLVLSKGPDRRVVPATVVGSTVPAAEAALKNVGLVKGTVTERFSSAAKGLVIATDPPVGTKLRPKAVVDLIVSKGREQLPVPDVQGKKQDEAVKILNGAGFKAAIVEVFSDSVPKGVVADQSPSSGLASRDSTITLQVSKGPDVVDVPNVTGMNVDEANAQLSAVGLKSQVIKPFGVGSTVHAQSPGGGNKVKRGSTVRLLVY
jgi:serine/threonine-protein kinase